MTQTFYFLHNNSIIEIDSEIVLARSEGNVIAKFDYELEVAICFIDKNQSFVSNPNKANNNRLSINGKGIKIGEVFHLKNGDKIIVGNAEYDFFDNFEEAERNIQKFERRRYKRPKNAYALSNFLNFYCAPPWALGLYLFIFLFSLSRYVPKIYIEAPPHLNFLALSYNRNIQGNMISTLVITWLLCLLHSFLMYLYFNRNSMRKLVLVSAFFVLTTGLVFNITRPLIQIRRYIEIRELIWNHQHYSGEKSIHHIKKLIDLKDGLINVYDDLRFKFSDEEQEILKVDFQESLKTVENEINDQNEVPRNSKKT